MDKRFAVRILIVTCVAHAFTHIFLSVYPPIKEKIALDLGLETTRVTFWFSVCTVFFGAGAVPAGWLSDRIGEKAMLVAFFLGCAAGGGLVGLAANETMLAGGFVVLGLATSIFHPVGNALITKGVERRGKALGINGIAGSAGTALGPAWAGLIDDAASWRWAFLGCAMVSLVSGLWLAATELGPAARPLPASSGTPSPAGAAPTPRPRPGRLRLFTFLLFAMTCGGFYFHLFQMALPEHMSPETSLATSASTGGYRAGLALAFGMIGQYVAGHLCDRRDERSLYVGVLLCLPPVLLAVGALESVGPMLALASLASLLMAAVQPIENSVLAEFTPAGWRGRIFGAKFILAFGIGGLGSWTAELITERLGSTGPVFTVAAGVAGLALVGALAARLVKLSPTPPAVTEADASG